MAAAAAGLLAFPVLDLCAQNAVSQTSGSWTNPAVWAWVSGSPPPEGYPQSYNPVFIRNNCTVTIAPGTPGEAVSINIANRAGTGNLQIGGQLSLSGNLNHVGNFNGGAGWLTILEGGLLTLNDAAASVAVGSVAGSAGTMTLAGTLSMPAGTLHVGPAGTGALTVQAGSLTAQRLQVGGALGADGTAVAHGATVAIAGEVAVSAIRSGGPGDGSARLEIHGGDWEIGQLKVALPAGGLPNSTRGEILLNGPAVVAGSVQIGFSTADHPQVEGQVTLLAGSLLVDQTLAVGGTAGGIGRFVVHPQTLVEAGGAIVLNPTAELAIRLDADGTGAAIESLDAFEWQAQARIAVDASALRWAPAEAGEHLRIPLVRFQRALGDEADLSIEIGGHDPQAHAFEWELLAGSLDLIVSFVPEAPYLLLQPQDQAVPPLDTVRFSIEAIGYTPGLQWQESTDGGATWHSLESEHNPVLTLSRVAPAQSGNLYRCRITASDGGISYSRWAQLTVFDGAIAASGTEMARPLATAAAPAAVAAGRAHTLLLLEDGAVLAWGCNRFGQCEVPNLGVAFSAIAAGWDHSLAVTDSGQVVAWGHDGHGQTRVPDGLDGVVAVAAGRHHSVALRADGTVVSWGFALPGAQSPSGIQAIAAGAYHTLALKQDGSVQAWGYNLTGETSVPAGLSDVTAIAAGDGYSVAARGDGSIVVWGSTHHGQGTPPAGGGPVGSLAAGWTHAVALKADGSLLVWGDGSRGQLAVPSGIGPATTIAANSYRTVALLQDGRVVEWGRADRFRRSLPMVQDPVSAVATGWGHSLALKADGGLAAWGSDLFGESSVPHGLPAAVMVAAGDGHSLALLQDGSVAAWGANHEAQADVPGGMPAAIAVAAGGFHSLALGADGTVRAWGSNSAGQASVPVDLGQVVQLSAGTGHSVALLADGTVYAWGANDRQQAAVPPGLASVKQISAGWNHTLALLENGTVVAWGDNAFGQTEVHESVPGVVAVAAGPRSSAILLADGTVLLWGQLLPVRAGETPQLPRIRSLQAGAAGLAALADRSPLAIARQPADRTVTPPAQAFFHAGVSGAFQPVFQWQFSPDDVTWEDMPGQDDHVLFVVAPAQDGRTLFFRVRVTDASGTALTSQSARLDILLSGFQAWALVHGLTGDDALPEAQPFQDGVSNLVKYALGLPGDRPASPGELLSLHWQDGWSLVWHTNPDAPDAQVHLQRSSDLSPGSWITLPVTPGTLTGDGRLRHEWLMEDLDLESSLFFRLSIQP